MKSKKKFWLSSLVIAITGVFLMFAFSCNKDDDPSTGQTLSYLAAGSYGDVIVFEIDHANQTIHYTNETVPSSGTVPYTLSTNPYFTGGFEISYNNNTYYAMELPNLMFVTTFPSGNLQNQLCFGVHYGQSTTPYTMSQLAGKYLFTVLNQNSNNVVYGGYELDAQGTINWSLGPADPSNFDENVHFAGNASTWSMSTTHPERIVSSANGNNYTGIIFPGKIMLIDNGVGAGLTLGLAYPASNITLASISGDYQYLDVTLNNEIGVGSYTIPTLIGGDVDYSCSYSGSTGTIPSGTLTNFTPMPSMKNAFTAEKLIGLNLYTAFFVVLPGDMFFQVVTGPSGVVSYGIGVKI